MYNKKMSIEWAPLFNVPMHRRLELLSVGLIVFCEIALGPICTFIFVLFIVISIEYQFNHCGDNVFFLLSVHGKCLHKSHLLIIFRIHLLRPSHERPWWSRHWVNNFKLICK